MASHLNHGALTNQPRIRGTMEKPTRASGPGHACPDTWARRSSAGVRCLAPPQQLDLRHHREITCGVVLNELLTCRIVR